MTSHGDTSELSGLLAELERLGEKNDASEDRRAFRYLNITRDTGEFLAVMIRSAGVKHILEVGTSNGYSTLWLASALPEDGHVTTLEVADHKVQQAANNFRRANLAHRITLLQTDASAYLGQTEDQFDLVFLDADRSSYAVMADRIIDRVRPGGLLICDNAISHASEMAPFVRCITQSGEFTVATVPVGKGEFMACRSR